MGTTLIKKLLSVGLKYFNVWYYTGEVISGGKTWSSNFFVFL